MIFRKSTLEDVDTIMNIIKEAQKYFIDAKIDQWQNNYPNLEIIKNDIISNNGYVLIKDNDLCAIVTVSFNDESTYNAIYEGRWLSNEDYAVIHRIAVKSNYKRLGLSSFIIKQVEELCLKNNVHSIKVDTHRDNIVMQNTLKKNGFKYCGIIYLDNGSERLAFEKLI